MEKRQYVAIHALQIMISEATILWNANATKNGFFIHQLISVNRGLYNRALSDLAKIADRIR